MSIFSPNRETKNLDDIIFKYAPIGIAKINHQGVFDSVNPEFLEIHGKAEKEFIGVNVLEFSFYKQLGLDNSIRQALAGQKFNVQTSFISSVGARESFRRYIGVPVFKSDNKTVETVILMVQDITNENRLEADIQDYLAKLKQEQSRFLASINSLSLGFIIIDVRTNLLIKNRAADDILDLPHEGEILLKGDILQTEEKLKNYFDLRANYEKCMAEKQAIDVKEIQFGTKFLHIFSAPIMMPGATKNSQDVIGAAILIEDITEAKVIERSREEFFAIASHELRTPLTAIRGNMSLLKDFYSEKIKDTEVMEMIGDSYNACIRLLGIVNDFLDASRLEQGKLEFKKEPFDAANLIQEVVSELEKLATGKKLYLKLEKIETNLPLVVGDKDRAKQILANLIGNAVNYTQKGGITVKAEKQDKFVKIYVSDTGVGIRPENQTLLFRKFQQAGEKILTRDVTKGTGLGLYISKLLAEAMASTIELVKSEPGVGSTFSFTLPISL